MKTVGILGGMSWESTLEYYRLLNVGIRGMLGWHHSAKIVLYSCDFDEIKTLQTRWEWEKAGELLSQWAQSIENAGADFLLLATNTMHKVAPTIEQATNIPLIHIADGTGKRIIEAWYRRVGLLGTRFTMDQDFYRGRLSEKYGLDVLTPSEEEKDDVHRIIYEELCLGIIQADSRMIYRSIIEKMRSNGAECVILGCTEIGLLIDESTSPLPVFDTTKIHVEYALEKMIAN